MSADSSGQTSVQAAAEQVSEPSEQGLSSCVVNENSVQMQLRKRVVKDTQKADQMKDVSEAVQAAY